MARVSRKRPANPETVTKEIEYQAFSYLRLSVLQNSVNESESIASQRQIIHHFIDKNKNMKLMEEFVEDGKSGTTYDRPAFQQMMGKVKKGQCNCIIVKDLSRFGRNFEETEEFMMKIFPFMKIRFIAIHDGYDSLSADSDTILYALKNLFNDFYARDVSLKVSRSFDSLREEGKYWGSRPPYGYLIDPKDHHHLVRDPDAAEHVKHMYEMVARGESLHAICRHLHVTKVLPPFRSFYEKGFFQCDKYAELTRWYRSTVTGILKNPVYYGALAVAKSKRSLWQNIPRHIVPLSERKYVEDMHAPIVSKELFNYVNDILEERSKKEKEKKEKSVEKKEKNLFAGKIHCGYCKNGMIRNYFTAFAGKRSYYFLCKDYSKDSGRNTCPHNYIRENQLKKIVFEVIQKQIEAVCDIQGEAESQNRPIQKKTSLGILENQITILQHERKNKSEKKQDLYYNMKRGLLSLKEYTLLKAEYAEELADLEDKLTTLEERLSLLSQNQIKAKEVGESFECYRKEAALSEEMADVFLENIDVYANGRLEIKLRFQDPMIGFTEIPDDIRKGNAYDAL